MADGTGAYRGKLGRPAASVCHREIRHPVSQLEYIIRHLLGAMMHLGDRQFDIITGSFDFARLCKVTEAFLLSLPDCDEKLADHAKKTFAKCLRVNDDRVRIVHGTWLLGPGTTHLSRNSLKITRHFEKPEEIVAKALEAKALMTDIVEILIGNADERRQFVVQNANNDK